MANHKSAKKRIRQTLHRNQNNKQLRSRLRTLEKDLHQSIEKKEKDNALKKIKVFNSEMDRSVRKGIHHKNKVSRKKSHLAVLVNKI